MVSSNDFKTGMTIEYEDKIYQILEFQHVKPGKGQAYVRTKLKNMRTGTTTEIAIPSGIKIKNAIIEKKVMQYIYDGGDSLAFMDMESYVQIDIPAERLVNEKNFLKEGMEVTVIDYSGEILGVMLPEKVVLEVTECDPNVKGNTVSNAMKGATVETGYSLQVPLFIEVGDKIIIGTYDGKYNSRA
ncbi:MAG: elongation factor P [Bacilli bacterium]|nr:elongation factor P [Bacilli bacterium]